MQFDVLTLLPASACEDETHQFAGHCTPECARLVEMMGNDGYYEPMIYSDYLGGESSIDWSGCHAGPIMPDEAVEYDATNRAVILVMVHPEDCQCPRHEDECRMEITFGPRHEPYGASCEAKGEHDIHFQQGDPFGNRDVVFRWTGGGSVAGDSLPFRILLD